MVEIGSEAGNHLSRSAILTILCAKIFPTIGRKGIRTEERKDREDPADFKFDRDEANAR